MHRLARTLPLLFACSCGDSSPATSDAHALADAGPASDGMSASHDLSASGSDGPLGGDDGPLGGDDAAPFTGMAAPATQANGRYFPDGAPWYVDVSTLPVAADSSDITSWMMSHAPAHGWGTGTMRIDFSIVTVDVPAGTPKRTYANAQGYYYQPDCDSAPIPVPMGGAVENDPTLVSFASPWSGYDCPGFANGDDCHMLFLSRSEHRLYEVYHGTIDSSNQFTVGCLAVWDLGVTDPDGRGQQCTSADAAGFSVAALLFTPEEVKAGHIDHAIRFILPNAMIRAKTYVAPATHGTSTSGPSTSGPYGFRMRLKASYPIGNLSPGAQVIARAMQKYGMLLADGGNIALTAQSDVLSTVKWADLGVDDKSLAALDATDFEVVADTPTTAVTDDCTRTPITQ